MAMNVTTLKTDEEKLQGPILSLKIFLDFG
jgi:hypothetical protein